MSVDSNLDDKTKNYFGQLGRYLAWVVMSVVVLTLVGVSSALVSKWTGITPALPTMPPPPIPVKAQEPVPAVAIPVQAI